MKNLWVKVIYLLLVSLFGCFSSIWAMGVASSQCHNCSIDSTNNGQLIIDLNRKLSELIVYDKFSPPVASRIFAYANLSARVVASKFNKTAYPKIRLAADAGKMPNFSDELIILSTLKCFNFVAKEMLYSQAKWKAISDKQIDKFIDDKHLDVKSVNVADSVAQLYAKQILAWASDDGYAQRLSFKKYEVLYQLDSTWKPTAPSYGLPVEPYWGMIRPFYLSSVDSFLLNRKNIPFSTNPKSAFYKMVKEVYRKSKKIKTNQKNIASFWDCNPIQSKNYGHVMLYNFRLTPADHWILLTGDIINNTNWDIYKTIEFYSDLSMSMADAFIVCWKSKYDHNLIRPETFINKYISKEWKPFIETPVFPEYPSGHSLVSTTAAQICNFYLGENTSFTDKTQTEFGLEEKHFKNFNEASNNAGISRFYGGIHYLPSIKDGTSIGKCIGLYIIENKIK